MACPVHRHLAGVEELVYAGARVRTDDPVELRIEALLLVRVVLLPQVEVVAAGRAE
jgi:hypothetical protein